MLKLKVISPYVEFVCSYGWKEEYDHVINLFNGIMDFAKSNEENNITITEYQEQYEKLWKQTKIDYVFIKTELKMEFDRYLNNIYSIQLLDH